MLFIVIPAKAGIQRKNKETGFRIKCGMTKNNPDLIRGCSKLQEINKLKGRGLL